MAIADLTAEALRLSLHYNPETGKFFRRGKTQESGRIATKGYRQISVGGHRYMAHRLAWLYVYGQWPEGQLDHINQVKDDNRIDNLRVVDNQTNSENITKWAHSTTGFRGVSKRNSGGYQADIKVNGRSIYLGTFENIQDAIKARMDGEKEHFRLLEHSPIYSQFTHLTNLPSEIVPVKPGPRAPKQCNE